MTGFQLTPEEIRTALLGLGVPAEKIQMPVQPVASTPTEIRRAHTQAVHELERRKMAAWSEMMGLPVPVSEYRFHPVREWRFDYAWIAEKVALEKDGGLYPGGAHSLEANIRRDQDKGNEAQLMGWCFLRVPASELYTSSTAALIRRALDRKL